MYAQYYIVMFCNLLGWFTLRDDDGERIRIGNKCSAVQTASALKGSPDVIDSLIIRVEEAEVYDYVTRRPMVHTTYTGVNNA